MRIQHNIMAMNAYRNYNNNTRALSKNLERLSSGYKINRAGDDAAGLAISEKMRAQITGLQTAQDNVKDGISLVNTAEGAMQEIQDMLNRMVELATKSANGTFDDDVDRKNIQQELDQLRSEINRIADSANFNGTKLLNGSLQSQAVDTVAMTMKGGAAVASSMVDGTAPSAAGNAEILVQLKNANAYQETAATYDTKASEDGTAVNPAEKAEFTIKIGGAVGAITGNGTIGSTAMGSAVNLGAGNNVNLAGWTSGDSFTITDAAGNTYEYDYDTINAAMTAAGTTPANDYTDLLAAMQKDGFKVTDGSSGSSVVIESQDANVTLGSDTSANIVAGTTSGTAYEDLKDVEITIGGNNVKLGDYFDIKVNGSAVSAANATTKIANGDEIVLTAKFGGTVTGTAYETELKKITTSFGAAASAVTVADASTSKVTEAGLDESTGSAGGAKPTKYTMTFDLSKLNAGQKFEIGGNKFEITNGGTVTTGYTAIDISGIDDTTNGDNDGTIQDELAEKIRDAIAATTDFSSSKFDVTDDDASGNSTIGALDGNTSQTFTLTFTTKDGVSVDDTNLGEFRVTVNDSDAITMEYEEGLDAPNGGVAPSAFATAVYKGDEFKAAAMKAGSSFTIAGKTVKVIDATEAATDDGIEAIRKGLAVQEDTNAATVAERISAAFEKQNLSGVDSGIGKVVIDTTAGTLTITGTTCGQTAAALKSSIDNAGSVKVFNKAADTTAASTIESTNSDLDIIAGTTTVGDLKDAEIAPGIKLSDAFDITILDANDDEVSADDDTVIDEGYTVIYTAKDKGKLDSTIMEQFAYEGDVQQLQRKEGNDEGQSADSANTHYDLTFDLSKLAGGNSFTFGNVNGKSVTFEISFDPQKTQNGTVAPDPTDVANNDDRVVINLFGMDEEQRIAEIKRAINDNMGTDFAMSTSLQTDAATGATKLTVNLDARNPGSQYNLGGIRFSAESDSMSAKSYIPAGGAGSGQEGTYAQVSYDFDIAQLKSGDSLTIGDKTVYIGDEDSVLTETDENGVKTVKYTVAAEGLTAEKLISKFEETGYQAGQLRIADGKLTITGVDANGQTGEALAADASEFGGKVVWTAASDRDFTAQKGGLTLQIGDTSDSFNQLRVSIGDMHVTAMHGLERDADGNLVRDENGNSIETSDTIDTIDFSTQDGAQKAINVIKDAINYVSSVRGNLGAISNRLDHTANNLSVMEENIQDAESSIRDTDIAEEMMAYTKNNILVQSAQAMLAQANQVPQGVLQLLQ